MPILLQRTLLYVVLAALIVSVLYSTPRSFGIRGSSWVPSEPPPYVHPPKVNDGRFHWEDLPTRYLVTSMVSLPSGRPIALPRVQHNFPPDFESPAAAATRKSRRTEVKQAFKRCWKAYRERAWMKDEVAPISGGSRDTFGGWAATLVDSLDTLWIMGMKEDFEEAVTAAVDIDFSKSPLDMVNVFKTTIRYLGGFLSAYDLSGDKRLLDKAVEVGEMLYVAFDTPNRMPITRWYPEKAKSKAQVADEGVLVAELGSLTMEFTRLSQLTQNMKWYDAVQRITDLFDKQQNQTKLPGMWPVIVNARNMNLTQDIGFSLGAMADSLFEYFPKTYALLGGRSPQYKKLYEESMAAATRHNFWRPMTPENADILISGNVRVDPEPVLEAQGQHLVCFVGGMLALGSRIFGNTTHLDLAEKITNGCIYTYKALPLGIMPETFHMVPCPSRSECKWDESVWHTQVLQRAGRGPEDSAAGIIASERLPPGFTAIGDRRYILRPEAVESVFILYRVTGRADLLNAAWDMFSSIQRYTRTDLANAALSDVTVTDGNPPKSDSMENFWMAETLKYFYLIFSEPDLINLDDYVFNTEAHPFKRPK